MKDDNKDYQALESKKIKRISFEEAKTRYEKEQLQKEDEVKLKKRILVERGINVDPFSFPGFLDMLDF